MDWSLCYEQCELVEQLAFENSHCRQKKAASRATPRDKKNSFSPLSSSTHKGIEWFLFHPNNNRDCIERNNEIRAARWSFACLIRRERPRVSCWRTSTTQDAKRSWRAMKREEAEDGCSTRLTASSSYHTIAKGWLEMRWLRWPPPASLLIHQHLLSTLFTFIFAQSSR